MAAAVTPPDMVASTGLVLLLVTAVYAFQWTSDIHNGGNLQRCVGDNVTFSWSYVTESEENVIVHFWFSNKSGSFASYFADNFSTSWDRVTQAGTAGVTLYDVSTADEDTYGVSVMLYDRQGPLTQHITLTVAEPPSTTDSQLHVNAYTKNFTDARNTSPLHMRLQCGEFLSLDSPPVSVLWTDPSGHRLPSTTFHDGYFYLDLEPHARGGNYTCSVHREAEATHCLTSDSPLPIEAGWELVTMETMVLDQGAELRQLRRTLEELSQQVELSHVTHTNTSGALWHTVTALEQGQTNRIDLLEGQEAELHNTQAELLQAAVDQNNTISSLQSQVADLKKQNADQNTQISGFQKQASDQNTQITSLRSQVADLQKQNIDQNTQISSLQSQVADLKNIVLELSQNTHISSQQQQMTNQNTQIAGLQKQVSDQNTQISSLQNQNTDQNTHISGLQQQVTDQNTQISSLQKEALDKNTQISNLQKENGEQNTVISGLQKQVSEQNTQISGLQKQVSEQNTQISGLQKQVSEQNTQISGLRNQASDQSVQVSSLQKQVSQQNIQISSLENQMSEQNTQTSSLQKESADQNTKFSGLQKQVSDQNTQISGLQKQVSDQNIQISGIQKQATDQNTQISGLQKQNTNLNTQISGQQKQNTNLNTQITSLKRENADLNTQISGLKKENADQKTQISSLQSDLQTIHTDLEKADVDIHRVLDGLGQNLTTVTSQLMTKTDRLQVSQESLSSDVRAQTQQVTSLQTSVSSLQSDVKLGGTTLTTLQTELGRINTLTAPLKKKAGFYAYLATPTVTVNQPVVFKLGSHVGGGYDASSGVYTAPYSGWYTLQAQLFPQRDTEVWFDIMHNIASKARAGCYQKADGTFPCITSISMYVAKGDRLWVKSLRSASYWTPTYDSFFSGVLVTPD